MATATPMTALEFFHWANRPENDDKRWELVRGVPAELTPWPNEYDGIHVRVASLLTDYVIRRGAGSVAFLRNGIITARDPDTVRCPAVMVFLEPTPGGEFPPRYTTEVPRLVVELSAPGEGVNRLTQRISDYFFHGVPLVWVVDPADGSVATQVPKKLLNFLDGPDNLTGNGVLPDFRCRVADLFALPGQPDSPPRDPA